MKLLSLPKFSNIDSNKFFKTLNKRVNDYFKESKIRKTGNWKLYLKTVIIFSMFIVPYFFIIVFDPNQWISLMLIILSSIGMAGVGMNIMHDGNHGSFSNRKWVNKLMGSSIYILAGNAYNWQIQHNVLHHTFTNIHGHDEDLAAGRILRFSKHSKWFPYHKYQHFYSFLLYGLMTINWAITGDFFQTIRYLKRKLSFKKSISPKKQWINLIFTKIIYFTIWIVLPMVFLNLAWWKILIGFFVMHYIAGIILTIVFQLAHVVEKVEMPLPSNLGNMKNSWAIHQLFTTSNFSTNNKILNWFSGGLNFQVEHHLFPKISHIHYKKISKIVKKTVLEFNLPYNEYRTTRDAIKSHFNFLKLMGTKPAL
ncbi:MAG TPA: acyl-CoA desaturase [Cytophagales bacterium]|jgi:linoleoyl-CoA desaturase|nr:acyl-CoA desaturase [Cytophagales bacterium]